MEAAHSGYLDGLLRGAPGASAGPRGWLTALRAQALECANALSVPTTRDEDWRFTDLSPLYHTAFQRAERAGALTQAELSGFALPEAGCRLVFVDGHFVDALSTPATHGGIAVRPFAGAEREAEALLSRHLGRAADVARTPFAALNTAWLQDGALVAISRNCAVDTPIHLLFVSTRTDAVSYPRILVVAEAGSDCTLVEDYVSLHDGVYLTNAVAEVYVQENARLRHIRLQREGEAAFHICACAVRIERDGAYHNVSVATGARISRYDLDVVQGGEGTDCTLDGLALIDGRQLADTHSLLDHAVPNGRSRQLHKCIVGGAAHAVFNGKIIVRPGAQHTDSAQQSRNLLLTGKAHVDTKPQLEIFADDVKCAHGAAIGQLDPEQLFYLQSRGLARGVARDLLIFAFAAEIVERIPVPTLVRRLEDIVVHQTRGKQA